VIWNCAKHVSLLLPLSLTFVEGMREMTLREIGEEMGISAARSLPDPKSAPPARSDGAGLRRLRTCRWRRSRWGKLNG
jgi:hypothetical protein